MCTHSSYLDVFLIALFSIYCNGYVDYTGSTELIQQRVGNDLKLRCDLNGLVNDEKLKDLKIHWFFKQCGDNALKLKNCQDNYEDDWTELPCENYFCKQDLQLRNVTEKYSGLYKCTVYPHERSQNSEYSLDIQLVRTYQVDVRNTTIALPVFLENSPINESAFIGDQFVFQCRVHSEVHPTIKWFRRLPETRNAGFENFVHDNFSSHIVRYNGHTYELLPATHEKFISDETYLSKLIINGVHWQDEGYYACVAVNYRGHRMQLFHLSVSANPDETEYFADYEDEYVKTDPIEFGLLFLMPLCLAMLPLSVWLIYRIHKNRKISQKLARQKLQNSKEQVSPEMQRILTA